jgi:hypothetical protein
VQKKDMIGHQGPGVNDVLVGHHKPLRGGTSAPQNLQGTVWLFLLAGTTCSLLQTGHVRLSCKITLIIAMNGFISSSLFLCVSRIFLSSKVLKIRLD